MRPSELFERVTLQIVNAIEAGAGDFQMPWHRWGQASGSPINAVSGRSYRGINTLLLWASSELAGFPTGRWATYRQWASAGAQVRKGETSTAVVFWKTAANDKRSTDQGDDKHRAGARFIARVYSVFNAAQVDGADQSHPPLVLTPGERIASAEAYFSSLGATLRYGGDRACYVPIADEIRMPQFEQFRDAEGFYSVLGHEHVHWSGADHRLARDLKGRFGTDAYAIEELVAELGSAFLAAHLGLAVEPRADHAAYLASWLRVLREDSRAILTASAKAQEAVDFLTSLANAEIRQKDAA